ncbi:Mannosylfructose-phosphate synthase [Jannaschia seosinensis]|uniref:Mannosylfructose-phosphate synthase n=1 Tax=Jannaschia seosinensis TaxID=313367 RepID=A0A0M7BHB7_9RHOB|nr:glycosyltransferase family 4 protein [Jannaschia seosinensis]CUH40746.1 Mannosylfructose-phosphate synthase [Jannaschia seosinensis]
MTEVVVTNLNPRYTGVSSTAARLIPVQARQYDLALAGHALPGCPAPVTIAQARRMTRVPPTGRPFAIWHVRRNVEMRAALIARDLLRLPIRIVFTTAGTHRHSLFPRWLMGRMDALIATIPAAAEGKPNVRAVVPHGVDCSVWHPPQDRPAAWAATGFPGRRGVAAVGRVRTSKGTDRFVETMLRVLPNHPDTTALVLGRARPQDAAFLQGLKDKVAAAGLADRLLFPGEVAPDAMPALIRACSLTVPLPRYEPYGVTPLEGMASGVPFVGSPTGDFRTFAADGAAGIVVEERDLVAQAAAAVDMLLSDEDRLAAMSRTARQRAVSDHSIEREAAGIAEVYEALWAEGSRARDFSAS